MSHPLAPLRHVYDVEPPNPSAGDPPTQGDPVETELLRGMRRVLEARPAPSPAESTVHAVLTRAASASATARPLYDAYAASAPLTGDAELLRQSRVVLERASASRPQPRPSSEVEARILARAAEASGLTRTTAPEALELAPVAAAYGLATATGLEAALVGSTRDALDRLPIHQPDAATVDAILAQAALASAPKPAPTQAAPAPDRTAVPAARRRRVGGIWAGSAALFAVALVALMVLPRGEGELATDSALSEAAPLAAQVEIEAEPPATDELVEEREPQASAPLAAAAAPRIVQRSAPRGPSAADVAPVRAERPVASSPPPASVPPEVSIALADADLSPEAESMPEWDVSDDVRLLSLRLQELRRQNEGVMWDQPAEAFGARSASPGATPPGVQAVRDGAAPVRAQVRVRSDSSRSNR